jgi:hypothetical protein
MGPVKLIRLAAGTRREWQALPPDERELLRTDADRVRDLSAELSRRAASGIRAGSPGPPPHAERSLAEIRSDLTTALADLATGLAPHAQGVVRDHTPRSVRIGTRAAKFALRQADKRMHASPQDTPHAATAQLPAGLVPWLEQYGYHRFVGQGVPDVSSYADYFRDLPRDGREAFVTALAEAVVPSGGWAVWGAAKLLEETAFEPKDHPAYATLFRASAKFERSANATTVSVATAPSPNGAAPSPSSAGSPRTG